MDFGALDGLVSSESNNLISGYDLDPNPKWFGSPGGPLKPERPVSSSATPRNEDEWRHLKMAKISEDDLSKGMLFQQQRSNCSSVCSDSQNMLSFSSPNAQSLTLPYYARNITGYGVKGPFTPSQWMELEHQALIYKYMTVNAPIPSNLLIPIRKALEAAAFSAYPPPHLKHNPYGWGAFHLGFSNNSDPEPGRCRRTDGKKWRCSRDAVADQKYCERHINRGRHRSRKPVEGHSGHSAATTTATTAAGAAAVTTTSTIVSHLHHLSSSSSMNITTNPAASNKSFLNKTRPEPTGPEFGLVFSDSLLNPLQKSDNNPHKAQNSLHQFMDNWSGSDSIPMGPSPITERPNFSPLRMGLGLGHPQPAGWTPVSWESSMGGPLGEVLNHNSPSGLNLMADGWESGPQMGLSPTGVLQKAQFGSVSNSSTGSSPRADSNVMGSCSLPLL